jgi:hypothetical protein
VKKRGQVTVFIILGIFILLSAISFFFLKDYIIAEQIKQDEADTLELTLNADKVKGEVNWCIDRTAKDAIINLGYYGGKEDFVGPFFDEEVFDANYLYYLGETETSSIDEMEVILSGMMEEQLPKCFEKFESLKKINVNDEIVNTGLIAESFQLEKGKVNSSVVIEEGVVNFNLNWPIQIHFKDKVKEIEQFPNNRLNIELERMGLFLEEFMERMETNPQFVDLFYLLEQNYSIHTSVFNNDTYVFLFEDENSIVDYEPLTFLFSVKVNSSGVLV